MLLVKDFFFSVFDPESLQLDRSSSSLLRSASVSTVRGRHSTVSRLTLAHVDMAEAGNYTCVPIGIDANDYHVIADTVTVVVSPQPQDTPDWAKAGGGALFHDITYMYLIVCALATTIPKNIPYLSFLA